MNELVILPQCFHRLIDGETVLAMITIAIHLHVTLLCSRVGTLKFRRRDSDCKDDRSCLQLLVVSYWAGLHNGQLCARFPMQQGISLHPRIQVTIPLELLGLPEQA
jgi:hypothetical protein